MASPHGERGGESGPNWSPNVTAAIISGNVQRAALFASVELDLRPPDCQHLQALGLRPMDVAMASQIPGFPDLFNIANGPILQAAIEAAGYQTREVGGSTAERLHQLESQSLLGDPNATETLGTYGVYTARA